MISTQDGEKSDTTGQKFVARACSHQGGPLLKSHVFDLLNWTIKQAPATSPTSTTPPRATIQARGMYQSLLLGCIFLQLKK